MKKLLVATDNYLPRWDGIARFLTEVLPTLKENYEITLIAPQFGSDKELEEGEIKIVRFKNFKFTIGDFPPARPIFKKISELVKETDIVWTQTIGPIGAATIYIAKRHNKPVVAYVHSLEWDLVAKSIDVHSFFRMSARGLAKKIAKMIYNRTDVIMVPSLEVMEILNWQRITPKKKVVHLGTDTRKFMPSKNIEEAKKSLGISPEKKVIGFVGRLGREKNLITLHRAFLRLEKSRNDVVLLIVGDGVKEIAQLFKNKQNIVFTGAQDNVIPYYQAMDIYVLSSLIETSSLSTMEAMASGCAVICTPVGYVKDYIIEGFNGMFFPQEEPYILSRKIEELLNNPDKMKKMRENARKTILNEYSWENTIKEIKEVLESVSEPKHEKHEKLSEHLKHESSNEQHHSNEHHPEHQGIHGRKH